MSYHKYRETLLTLFKSYREKYFSEQDGLFHDNHAHVFKKKHASFNLFIPQQGVYIPVNRVIDGFTACSVHKPLL